VTWRCVQHQVTGCAHLTRRCAWHSLYASPSHLVPTIVTCDVGLRQAFEDPEEEEEEENDEEEEREEEEEVVVAEEEEDVVEEEEEEEEEDVTETETEAPPQPDGRHTHSGRDCRILSSHAWDWTAPSSGRDSFL
jgi:hypothetical protein